MARLNVVHEDFEFICVYRTSRSEYGVVQQPGNARCSEATVCCCIRWLRPRTPLYRRASHWWYMCVRGGVIVLCGDILRTDIDDRANDEEHFFCHLLSIKEIFFMGRKEMSIFELFTGKTVLPADYILFFVV